MVYIFTGPRSEVQPPSFADIARIAKAKDVPVVVDAAAEFLTIPNHHLQQGATMVCYSGGKCIISTADRSAPACCWEERTWSRRRGFTAPRTMASPAA